MSNVRRNIKDRYWVFYIPEYYPSGGLGDINITTNIEEEAIIYCEDNNTDIYQYYTLFDSVDKLWYSFVKEEWV